MPQENKKATRAQIGQAEKLAGDVIASLNLGKDELQQKVLDAQRAKVFQQRIREVLLVMLARHFAPLTDDEALVWLMEQAQKSEQEAAQIVRGCRKGALKQRLANSIPCHFAVEVGATLKQTIPTIGPCVDDFQYLQNWLFADIATEQCLVSGVPAALRRTTNQSLVAQRQKLAAIEQWWGVPVGFFSKELLPTVYTAGVALTFHKVTKQQMFDDLWVRTGTQFSGGGRLSLGWDRGRLGCTDEGYDEDADSEVAVVALGMTKALGC